MRWHTLFIPLFLALIGPRVHAARILAVMAMGETSHHRFMTSVLKVLAGAGHQVVFYSPCKPIVDSSANFTGIFVEELSVSEEALSRHFNIWREKCPKGRCWDIHLGSGMFQALMSSDKIKRLCNSKEKFDLVITEPFMMQEQALVFGYIFNAPTIAVSALPLFSIINNNMGNSLSISSLPDSCTAVTDKMSFSERIINAYYIIRRQYIYYNKQLPQLEHDLRKYFSDMPPLMEMVSSISLVFSNDHNTASHAQPRTPNIIPVAGIHLQPPQPLPQDIQRFMDEAPEGVILFSLGTFVNEHTNPEEYFEMVKTVFKQLKQRVIWKTKKFIGDLPQNVLAADWLPQQDILGHKNCVLFITQGGVNSMIEAIHFGVPMIVMPYIADQLGNAMYLVSKGVGIKLEPTELTGETLSTAISTVLGDVGYGEKMKALSAVFRDRPMSPEQTVVYWTEYVLRHRGAPHLRPPTLPFYQHALLDVMAALLAASIILIFTIYTVIVKIKLLICNFLNSQCKKATKTE